MSKSVQAAAIAAAMLAAGSLPLPLTATHTAIAASTVRCELRADASGNVTQLSAIAKASSAISGNYRLMVTKRGYSGSADIDQAGGFAIVPGAPNTLGQISVNLEPGSTFDAKLTVSWPGGTTSCSRMLAPAL
jgi:hypothetical protein